MARLTTCVQLDAQLHERWTKLRFEVSDRLRFNENSLGLQPMLGLLLDHWEHSPPDKDWLKIQAELYPKRGRPRRSQEVEMKPQRVALKSSTIRGHEVIYPRSSAGRIRYCKSCDMVWIPEAFGNLPEPPAPCPATSTVNFYNLRPDLWTKSELLALHFGLDEVEWADP